ncbi:hypothetical protein GMRT_10615 [Giardia muris]|uniref:Uncharacterized protein n=1 Tax=Giardia muris TaxID=5742 RepID=A0A4Z1SM89_GIAMU|nr:hypothetical protein GMRT_10615 [Giardia muris]|eukprot:TNJ26806.1 hypothetical protein GMRT_10615 [Giardia muris]
MHLAVLLLALLQSTVVHGAECLVADAGPLILLENGTVFMGFTGCTEAPEAVTVSFATFARTLPLTQQKGSPFVYAANLNSTLANALPLVTVVYSGYMDSAPIIVEMHPPTCLVAGNLLAGVLDETVYIYPKNLTYANQDAGKDLPCDIVYDPYLKVINSKGEEASCTHEGLFYMCQAASIGSGSLTVVFFDGSTETITPQTLPWCYNTAGATLSMTIHNRTRLSFENAYIDRSFGTPTTCIPVSTNLLISDYVINEYNFHWAIEVDDLTKKEVEAVVTLRTLVGGSGSDDGITFGMRNHSFTISVDTASTATNSLCYQSFDVSPSYSVPFASNISQIFTIQNLRYWYNNYQLAIVPQETCDVLPNMYLRVTILYNGRSYSTYAFPYPALTDESVLLGVIDNYKAISSIALYVPLYQSLTIGIAKVVRGYISLFFQLPSHRLPYCVSTSFPRYYCIDDTLYVSTYYPCTDNVTIEEITLQLYSSTGTTEYKLNYNKTFTEHVHYMLNVQDCRSLPIWKPDEYPIVGVLFTIENESIPFTELIHTYTDYCQITDAAFDFSAYLHYDAIHIHSRCNLTDYYFIDTVVGLQRRLIGSNPTRDVTMKDHYDYDIDNISYKLLPYIFSFRTSFEESVPGYTLSVEYYPEAYGFMHRNLVGDGSTWLTSQTRLPYISFNQYYPANVNIPCLDQVLIGDNQWYFFLLVDIDKALLFYEYTSLLCSTANVTLEFTLFTGTLVRGELAIEDVLIENASMTSGAGTTTGAAVVDKYMIGADTDAWSIIERELPRLLGKSLSLYANVTYSYIRGGQGINLVPVHVNAQSCIMHRETMRFLGLDSRTLVLEYPDRGTCYTKTDLAYIVIPTLATMPERDWEEHMQYFLLLEERLLKSFGFESVVDLDRLIMDKPVLDVLLGKVTRGKSSKSLLYENRYISDEMMLDLSFYYSMRQSTLLSTGLPTLENLIEDAVNDRRVYEMIVGNENRDSFVTPGFYSQRALPLTYGGGFSYVQHLLDNELLSPKYTLITYVTATPDDCIHGAYYYNMSLVSGMSFNPISTNIETFQAEVIGGHLTLFCTQCTIMDQQVIVQFETGKLQVDTATMLEVYNLSVPLTRIDRISSVRYNITYSLSLGSTLLALTLESLKVYLPVTNVTLDLNVQHLSTEWIKSDYAECTYKNGRFIYKTIGKNAGTRKITNVRLLVPITIPYVEYPLIDSSTAKEELYFTLDARTMNPKDLEFVLNSTSVYIRCLISRTEMTTSVPFLAYEGSSLLFFILLVGITSLVILILFLVLFSVLPYFLIDVDTLQLRMLQYRDWEARQHPFKPIDVTMAIDSLLQQRRHRLSRSFKEALWACIQIHRDYGIPDSQISSSYQIPLRVFRKLERQASKLKNAGVGPPLHFQNDPDR